MKRFVLTCCVSAFSVAAHASPTVAITAVEQDSSFNRVKVSYTLSEDAVVTWSATTNSAAVSPQKLTRVWGDINRKVSAPGGVFWWAGAEELDDYSAVVSTLGVSLTAWPVDDPPDYMVVDCAGKSNVTYYVSADAVPGGVGADVYKTTKMVMRKIPAKGVAWTMGAPKGEDEDRDPTYEVPHKVTLTEDYYIGIYPVTQGQYLSLAGSNPSAFKNRVDSPKRPVENVSYYSLRGKGNGVCWAATNQSHRVGEVLLTMRNATGIKFDFPTDAQWEYACRAGVAAKYNNGTDDMDAVGWNSSNWENDIAWKSDPMCKSNETHTVGLLQPNRWGLYDMHGNVCEWVLDWHGALNSTASVTDPAGANYAGDDYHFIRGGSWYDPAHKCRSAAHAGYGAFWTRSRIGFRLVAPAAGSWNNE
jgi:formylglycine-generating enzyme required for sulfatase activity